MRISPRIATLGVLLLITALALPARGASVDPVAIREAIEAAWVDYAVPGFALEVRHVPRIAHRGGIIEIEARFPEGPARAGPRAIPVDIRVEGRVVARGLANVMLRERVTVWVPVRPITRGTMVTAADLRAEPRTYDREPSRLFPGPESFQWVAARDLDDGQVLRRSDLDRKPDVNAGDEVLLVSKAGDASVSVLGRARRSGSVGDTILVLNPITGSIVRAVLVTPTTAMLVGPRNERSSP